MVHAALAARFRSPTANTQWGREWEAWEGNLPVDEVGGPVGRREAAGGQLRVLEADPAPGMGEGGGADRLRVRCRGRVGKAAAYVKCRGKEEI